VSKGCSFGAILAVPMLAILKRCSFLIENYFLTRFRPWPTRFPDVVWFSPLVSLKLRWITVWMLSERAPVSLRFSPGRSLRRAIERTR
jgi:hypothetical protein